MSINVGDFPAINEVHVSCRGYAIVGGACLPHL